MVALKHSEKIALDKVFDMGSGYVLNFSNMSMASFFEDELGIEIYQEKYAFNGTSKAKYLRAFIEIEGEYIVGQLLRKLWDYKISHALYAYSKNEEIEKDKARIFSIIERIEGNQSTIGVSKLNETIETLNFDTVSRDLKRALDNAQSDPESAITSACSTLESVCYSILAELGEELPSKKDIQGLFNAVKKPLGLGADRKDINPLIADDVRKILNGLSTVVVGIGALRTHGGDAHGRTTGSSRLDYRIANLSINSASTIALFLIETWQKKFPSKKLYKFK